MGKYATTRVKESKDELEKLHIKYQGERERKRIKMLMFLREKTFRTRQELADYLGIGKRTLERWVGSYEQGGIALLLSPIRRERESSHISAQIHEALSIRLKSSQDAFTSYKEIQRWLQREYHSEIKYTNLYYYLKKHFKTKLKVPRPSHIKKDEQAVAFFKNTTVKD